MQELIALLPGDLACSIFILVHRSASRGEDVLLRMLRGKAKLPVISPGRREVFKPGHVYLAPGKCNLLIEDGYLRGERGVARTTGAARIDSGRNSRAVRVTRR